MTKTVQEIQAEHGRRASEILLSYEDEKRRVREMKLDGEGPYFDRLTDEQRARLLGEEREKAAALAHSRTLEAYGEEVARYHSELMGRKAQLKQALFGVEGAEHASVLARAATATEGELEAMLGIAGEVGNAALGKAVFAVADKRGLGTLVSRYLASPVGSELVESYREWAELPSQELLERQKNTISRVVQEPDPAQLAPTARINA